MTTLAHVRIEFDRGDGQGFRMRQEGRADVTAAALIEMLPAYALQYPHKAFLNGELVGEHPGPDKQTAKQPAVVA